MGEGRGGGERGKERREIESARTRKRVLLLLPPQCHGRLLHHGLLLLLHHGHRLLPMLHHGQLLLQLLLQLHHGHHLLMLHHGQLLLHAPQLNQRGVGG